jgi:hypothetical protein
MQGRDCSRPISDVVERVRSRALRQFAAYLPFGPRYCCYCHQASPFFMPFQTGVRGLPSFLRALSVIGSDLDNHSCPKCGSHDRERHLKLYFDFLRLQKYVLEKKVLHFAPELNFSKYVQSMGPASYIKADLYPNAYDVRRVNMLTMEFGDEEFDLVIANHVLEHVSDVSAALRELCRVLKPGGMALLQTPYSSVLTKTFEDKGIVAPEARRQAFGQEDHVRLFGNDIFRFIEKFGLQSRLQTHQAALANVDATKHGVNPREPLFLFERTN